MKDVITKETRMRIVRENIAKGYGVEDISVMFRIPVEGVRYCVSVLRENGDLKHIFPTSKARAGSATIPPINPKEPNT